MTKQWEQRWSFDFTDDAALDAEIAQAEAKAIALALIAFRILHHNRRFPVDRYSDSVD